MHSHDSHDDLWIEFNKRREEWRERRDARREAWRARREERRNKWAHLGDPEFWGLDEASMRGCGMHGARPSASSEVTELKAKVADMEDMIARLNERIVVLEKLAVASDDVRLAAEIEKLRSKDE